MSFLVQDFFLRLFNLRLSWILLLLSLQGAYSQVAIEDYCGQATQAVNAAFLEAVDMAKNAYTLHLQFQAGTLDESHMRLVFNTFQTYFSDIIRNTPTVGEIPNGAQTAIQLINMWDYIQSLDIIPNSPITIYCSDDNFINSAQTGNGNVQYYYDLQSTRGTTSVMLPETFKPCGADANKKAYFLPDLKAIVLCPRTLALPPSVGDRTRAVTTIDDVYNSAISVALLGQLFVTFFPNDIDLHDLNSADDFLTCYALATWQPTSTVRQYNCITYYTLSLYMNGADWSTGTPRGLPV